MLRRSIPDHYDNSNGRHAAGQLIPEHPDIEPKYYTLKKDGITANTDITNRKKQTKLSFGFAKQKLQSLTKSAAQTPTKTTAKILSALSLSTPVKTPAHSPLKKCSAVQSATQTPTKITAKILSALSLSTPVKSPFQVISNFAHSLTRTGRKKRKRKREQSDDSPKRSRSPGKYRRVGQQSLQQVRENREALIMADADEVTDVEQLRKIIRTQKSELSLIKKKKSKNSFEDLITQYSSDGLSVYSKPEQQMAYCSFCCDEPAVCFGKLEPNTNSLIHGYLICIGVEKDSTKWHALKVNFAQHFAASRHKDKRLEHASSSSRAFKVTMNLVRLCVKVVKGRQSDNSWAREIAYNIKHIDYGNKHHSNYAVPQFKKLLMNTVCTFLIMI